MASMVVFLFLASWLFKILYMVMRRTLLVLSIAAIFGTDAAAQKLTVLPDEDGRMFMGQAISANGKYVCGSDAAYGMFVADWAAGKVVYAETTDDEGEGAELRSVSNDGLAVGYDGPAVAYDISGQKTYLGTVDGLAESITPDGKKIAGSEYENYSNQHAFIWVKGNDGYVKTALAEPRDAYLGYTIKGTTARHISADGSLIVGYMIDKYATSPALAWYLNRDETTYSVYPFSRPFFEGGKGTKPYLQFYATGVSSNGKWIALQLTDAKTRGSKIARYNVESDSLYVAEFDPNSTTLTSDASFLTAKIADDGTMLFLDIIGMMQRKAGIWKAGEVYPQLLSEAYPGVEELKVYDDNMNGIPTDITPDGRYIVGFGSNEAGLYETFVLDTQAEPSAISSAKTDKAPSNGTTVRYTVDGRRVANPVKGINIEVNPQGKARKVMVVR